MLRFAAVISGLLFCQSMAVAEDFVPPRGVTKMAKPTIVVGAIRDYSGPCGGVCLGTNTAGERCLPSEKPLYSSIDGSCECWADKLCRR